MATPKKKKAKAKKSPAISRDVLAQARKLVLQEMADANAQLEKDREAQRRTHQKYLEQMYASPDPWVEIQSWADTPQGVKVDLEWNDAFVEHLKSQGIQGTDEDQIVQKWVALLLMQINDSMENPEDRSSALE